MAQQLDEPLDARVPKTFIVSEPLVGALEGPRVDAAVVVPPAHGALHEPRALEGLYVLRHCGERHLKRRGELANGLLPVRESLEQRSARVVADGMKDEIEPVCMFNHM